MGRIWSKQNNYWLAGVYGWPDAGRGDLAGVYGHPDAGRGDLAGLPASFQNVKKP